MARAKGKRTLEDFDPLASDSQDSDYDDRAAAKSPKKPRKSAGPPPNRSHRPKKRRRRDSDEIEDDEDDAASHETWTPEPQDSEPEVNPDTGRPSRRTAKKVATYEESDASAIEESPDDNDDEEEKEEEEEEEAEIVRPARRLTRRNQGRLQKSPTASVGLRSRTGSVALPKSSLVVRFNLAPKILKKFPHTPSRPTSRKGGAAAGAKMVATRRSSRISHEPEDLIELTNSGRHSRPVADLASHEPATGPSTRRNVGGKGPVGKAPKKLPSAIFEESQGSQYSKEEAQTVTPGANLEEVAESREPSVVYVEQEQVDVEISDDGVEDDIQMAEAADEEEGEEQEEVEVVEAAANDAAHESDGAQSVHRSDRVAPSIEEAPPRSSSKNKRKRSGSGSSYYNPNEEASGEEDMSSSDDGHKKKKQCTTTSREHTSGSDARRISSRIAGRKPAERVLHQENSESEDGIDQDELAEEAAELQQTAKKTRSRRNGADPAAEITYERTLRRKTGVPTYNIRANWDHLNREIDVEAGDDEPYEKHPPGAVVLLNATGPFGGQEERSIFSPLPFTLQPLPGSDSDSSDDEDDEAVEAVEATPAGAKAKPTPGTGGAPADFGKVTKKTALADVSPLGIEEDVNFSNVGGLDDYINKLKEMVVLPLQYPELYKTQGIPPPRGVLFHGPPGNGKTLLARALASESTIAGKKVTFFMRKGADVLNKYVGEAERQLRLLFDEAQRCQPSIIFFDEIDGLAPVRSSKQEQIHASIVASLLALMDGMDDRGQVIVIGATNRPDHVDAALRRPGRFDREFYIPLPNAAGRRAILDIHTKKWNPPLEPEFKDHLAGITKGYSGADIRALCTESALHAIQATYPQIYTSKQKLLVDPTQIKVLPKDFIITLRKIVPSSERSTSTASSGTKKRVEPLIRSQADQIVRLIEDIMPQRKHLTALQEAMYDDRSNPSDFDKIAMELEFDEARVHRPRLLISGLRGMGQQYLAKAVLQKLETSHMQAFDLPTLLEDSTRTPESAIVQLFKEVRRHKPAIIFIPNVDIWWETVEPRVAALFSQLLRSIDPNDPVLLLGIIEKDRPDDKPDPGMMTELFGFTSRGEYEIPRPNELARRQFFEPLIAYIRMPPSKLPDPDNRLLRQLPVLPPAPVEQPKEPREADDPDRLLNSAKQRRKDLIALNRFKQQCSPFMKEAKKKYTVFKNAPLKREVWEHLDSALVSDLSQERQIAMDADHDWIRGRDGEGIDMLTLAPDPSISLYNVDIYLIEKRLEHGCYSRPKELLADFKRLLKDCKTIVKIKDLGMKPLDLVSRIAKAHDNLDRAKELVANIRVDIFHQFNTNNMPLLKELEALHARQMRRIELEMEAGQKSIRHSPKLPAGVANVAQNIGLVTTIRPTTPQHRNRGGDSASQHQSNGESVPSRSIQNGVEALAATGPVLPSAAAHTMTPSGASQQHSQHTQRSVFEKMAPGSSVTDYQNSASTTTSGQKTADRSNRASDRSQAHGAGETQSTNGSGPGREFPDFSMMRDLSGGSQIPDTQPNSGSAKAAVSFDSGADVFEVPSSQNTSSQQALSQAAGGHFSVPALPAHARASVTGTTTQHASDLASVLNPADSSKEPTLIINNDELAQLHNELATRSSGLSVEQLEQTLASLMDTVWRHRSKWNRLVVGKAVEEAFNRVVREIEEKQLVLKSSLEEAQGRARDEARRRVF